MKKRLIWPDIMKIVAIFGVIVVHVSAPYLVPFSTSREWWIGNIYDSLARWCVPLFVMVSGALLLPKAENIPFQQFLFVRVRRVLVPFLTWSALYFLYRIHMKGDALALTDFFRMVLTEPIYYHLWFIYMLIVLYLLAPAISAFLNESPKQHAWYLIALWFSWVSILPIIERPLDIETYFTPGMDDYSPIKLSGYFLLGYMFRDWRARSGFQFCMALLLFLAGGALTIIGTYVMSLNRGEFHPFFYNYFSISVVFMSVSLFILVKSAFHAPHEITADGGEKSRTRSMHFLQKIGMSVFGVYLIHALVLELLRDGRLGFTIDHTTAFGVTFPLEAGLSIFALSIFIFSLLPVLIIRFIPFVRDTIT